MKKFICVKNNKFCRVGQWLIAEDVGEPLFFARLQGGLLKQTTRFGISFESLALCIVEFGFELSYTNSKLPTQQTAVEEQRAFDLAVEDIVEPEVARRIQAAEPSYRSKSGIVVPGGKIGTDEGTG